MVSDEFYTVEGRSTQKREIGTDRIVEERFYNSEGQLDRGDQPALIYYNFKTGEPIFQEWYRNGELHREEGPAVISVIPGLKIVTHEWWKEGRRHRRNDQPAIVSKNFETGLTRSEEYFTLGRKNRPRDKGPAYIDYDKNTGEITKSEYWEFGERIRTPRRQSPPRPLGP